MNYEFDFNINNRLIVKDNHRPCVPRPIDQSPALPPPENDKLFMIGQVLVDKLNLLMLLVHN